VASLMPMKLYKLLVGKGPLCLKKDGILHLDFKFKKNNFETSSLVKNNITPFINNENNKPTKRSLVGVVIGTKMQKTAKVAHERYILHPKFNRVKNDYFCSFDFPILLYLAYLV
jgi:hypothetical protein